MVSDCTSIADLFRAIPAVPDGSRGFRGVEIGRGASGRYGRLSTRPFVSILQISNVRELSILGSDHRGRIGCFARDLRGLTLGIL
jgi:hypothetical protein